MNASKRHPKFMVLLLAVTLLPVLVCVVCPCASAASTDLPRIERQACRGCCPEMSNVPDCQAEIRTAPAAGETILKIVDAVFHPKALTGRTLEENTLFNVLSGAAGPPQPLYLSLQVLRI